MRRQILIIIIVIGGALLLGSWGFQPHRNINAMAVNFLPKPLLTLFQQNAVSLRQLATRPDQRRYIDTNEAARHYINLDATYFKDPDSIPRKWRVARKKYSADSLREYGIVPWHIGLTYKKLVYAFKNRDINRIIDLSADIGHYVADACVPLHSTKNYNGQFTGQKGIHGLWETEVPKVFEKEIIHWKGKAKYIPNVESFAWSLVLESFSCKDSVLSIEKKASEGFPQKYRMSRKQTQTKKYTMKFVRHYHQMLNGMVERRMRKAMESVASVWYSAWVDAGQPRLDNMGVYVDRKNRKK